MLAPAVARHVQQPTRFCAVALKCPPPWRPEETVTTNTCSALLSPLLYPQQQRQSNQLARRSATPAAPERAVMELFPDGHHVWLRSSGRPGMYLHAADDGVGVYLSPRRASLHTAWQVHRVEREGVPFVLLHGAAYGRYLAATVDPAPRGHRGWRVIQGVYDEQGEDAVAWNPIKPATGDDQVLLQHSAYSNRLLRANGKFCRWRTAVSVDDYFNRNTMMYWVVEAIPERPFTPALPLPSSAAPPGGFWNLFLGRTTPVVERRMIRFVKAALDGSFGPDGWRLIEFHGRSVYNLRSDVAEALNESQACTDRSCGQAGSIKLCVRAGTLGRLTPLVVDLPRNEEPIDLVVLSTSTPYAGELRDPDVEA